MSKTVAPVPRGYRTITPVIVVRGVSDAAAFYQSCFGAELHKRTLSLDGSVMISATLKIGNSLLRLMEESVGNRVLSPISLGGASGSQHLYVDDVNIRWQQAVGAGATPLSDLQDAYWGERVGTLSDPFGHVWTLASKIENLSSEELEQRVRDTYAA